ncbi:protein PUTATIVE RECOMBINATION INITIATION DEFECT 1 isoform X2 [Lactuca sativa]|uniref:protein PUTATIVE RECOMBINATION INITIATION DEFECT 1 isoform X2 n=1 Tax=Lactuca sativa TaxID=4236 RepID=UPI001C68A871|nr:protein PUTATIVE RECOMBINATION INITIATION DEFECT 1 isoform X2 [Lactuca sativa]
MHYIGSDHHQRSDSDQQLRDRQYLTCSQGHTSSLILQTLEGGSICLVCLSNLISNPNSPTIHVSYALSQLSQAISQPPFLHNLLTFHPHFLVSPLITALSSLEDEPLAKQTIDLISELCSSGDSSIYSEFVARVSDRLSSGSLAWSRRQIYMLHCLGVLLDNQKNDPYTHIKERDELILNLVTGLQLPSEEIQGEILFVLYKICGIQQAFKANSNVDVLYVHSSKILHLALEVLLKTQRDDVRLNCVALLSVLTRKGFFENAFENEETEYPEADNSMETTDHEQEKTPLNLLFAEAIKAPLLSSDCEVQTATLDLIVLYLSYGGVSRKDVQVLVEENIADYVFEILRLLGCKKDSLVSLSLQVLDLMSVAEEAFKQRLAIGFTTLIPVLHHVAEVPFHPAQSQSLKLISECISNCPGIISSFNNEEISLIMSGMLKRHVDGDANMLPETFTLVCSLLVALIKSPSCHGPLNIPKSLQHISRYTIAICLSFYGEDSSQMLHSLYLLKETYEYSLQGNYTELRDCILDICETNLLPWVSMNINEIDEDITLGVLEIFHSILTHSEFQPKDFVDALVSSSWFSFLFGCLGLFPTEKMKWRVYILLGSILNVILGNECGEYIKGVALHLPSDPIDLLFLLGQKGSHNQQIFSCQSAVLLILYTSSLYDDRLADDRKVLASLEQYILLNKSQLLNNGVVKLKPLILELLVNLYGLYRGLAKVSYQIPYSPDAENTLFLIISQKHIHFLSRRIHSTSLKWLFQQERISQYLSDQILRWCRRYFIYGNNQILVSNHDTVKFRQLAELAASEDNYAAKLLVCLLREVVEETRQEDDIVLLLNMISSIVALFPSSSREFCLNGISPAIKSLYSQHSCGEILNLTSELVFTILHSIEPEPESESESLSDDEAWNGIATELIHYLISTITNNGFTQEALLVMGILSLILYHSLHQNLLEASKTILLNTQLISLVNKMIHEACLKGPALIDHDEATQTGAGLIFLLFLNYFSHRSVHVILPGIEDVESLVNSDKKTQHSSLFYINIHSHDLCRLLHFGSTPVKLISSFCLLQLFQTITQQKTKLLLKDNIRSITSILQGLIFHSDVTIAMNCGLCISMVIDWEKQDDTDTRFVEKDNWCRLITEELVMSLAVPNLASKSIMIHHKPAVYVVASMLELQKVPSPWMSDVFDDSCINGIIRNLSSSNITREIVLLFRRLLQSGYLNSKHIACLNQLFQGCRKRVYSDDTGDADTEEKKKKKMVVFAEDPAGHVYEVPLPPSGRMFESHDGQNV